MILQKSVNEATEHAQKHVISLEIWISCRLISLLVINLTTIMIAEETTMNTYVTFYN